MPNAEALLAHSRWLRSLVRRLVCDGHDADDIEQQTWLHALARPPARAAGARRWLETVARNNVRRRRREALRRRRREQRVALELPRIGESTESVVARAGLHRTVVDAVLELDEPYRRTLLLRFFDGLPPREIARRDGCSVDTVRSRTRRGLDQLRRKLERRGVTSRALAAWLAGRRSIALPLLAGAGLVAVTAGASLLGWSPVGEPAIATTTERPTAATRLATVAVAGSGRTPAAAWAPATVTVAGRVTDSTGAPAAGARVVLVDPERDPRGEQRSSTLRALDELVADARHRTVSDHDGAFAFAGVVPSHRWTLAAVHPELGIAVETGLPIAGDLRSPAVALEGGSSIAGRLTDELGSPVTSRVVIHGFRNGVASPVAELATDGAGRFETPPLRCDRFAISVAALGFEAVIMRPFAGGPVQLRRRVGPATVPGFGGLRELLSARGFDAELSTSLLAAVTVGAGGRLELGPWELAVAADSPWIVDPAAVPRAPARCSVDVRGTVPGASVEWTRLADRSCPVGWRSRSSAAGSVSLLAGRYRARATARGWVPVERELAIDRDLAVTFELTEPSVDLQGSVRGEQPVAGALVEVFDAERVVARTRTNRDGVFVARDLRPGRYRVVATVELGSLTTALVATAETTSRVELRLGGIAPVSLVSERDGGPFFIRIVDERGFAFHDGRRHGRDQAGNRFDFGLASGRSYTVELEARDGRWFRETFVATAGREIAVELEERR